jgi:DNA-binding transcriptional LysR family regulator
MADFNNILIFVKAAQFESISRAARSLGMPISVYRGHGIGLLPSTYCDEQLAKGALIRLMPKWTSPKFRYSRSIRVGGSCPNG